LPISTHTRSCRSLIIAASWLLLAQPTQTAMADDVKPAVDRLNGQLIAAYGYDETAAATASGGGSTSDLPGAEKQGPEVGGVLSFPVIGPVGGRAAISGRLISVEQPAYGLFPGGDASGFGLRGGFDLFLRNPDSGFFGVGYRFRWGDPAEGGADNEVANGLNVAGGFFIPDQDMGPIDWKASFSWLRASLEGEGFSDEVDEYSGVASSGWYLTESLRFTGGFEWALDRPVASPGSRDLRGSADLAWLLPIGRVRYATLTAKGTGGKLRSELAAPLSSVDRTVWSIGGAVSFNFPGATSLVQLTRERQ